METSSYIIIGIAAIVVLLIFGFILARRFCCNPTTADEATATENSGVSIESPDQVNTLRNNNNNNLSQSSSSLPIYFARSRRTNLFTQQRQRQQNNNNNHNNYNSNNNIDMTTTMSSAPPSSSSPPDPLSSLSGSASIHEQQAPEEE